jgi:hypothetical protein
MTNITVITTFHKPGMILYGQRFIDSFADKVDKKIKLVVYAEDCLPTNPDQDQISILNAKEVLPKLSKFKEKWKDIPKANGKCPWPEKRPKDFHKEFKWDAVRFANKVYAVFDACTKGDDWVVWMDADSFIHTVWNYEDWLEILPKTSWITYVGRGTGSQSWPECGFYGLNLHDFTCKEFLKEFERMYEDAEHGIFKLDEWHDSFVFGKILNSLKIKHPNVIDYTAELSLIGAKSGGGGHPLINSKLGKWMDHMKGDRKALGKSKKTDVVVQHKNSYWQ